MKWCEKFDRPEFYEWRLENGEDSQFVAAEVITQQFLVDEECCGNFDLLPCLSGTTNDDENSYLNEENATQKSEQCKYCYWYTTCMNIIMDGPGIKESKVLQTLVNELDDDLAIFTVPPS